MSFYGLMYVLAFGLAWIWLYKKYAEKSTTLIAWTFLGVIIGGRLGYVLLYEPIYFWNNFSEIITIWQGGMAFHGGLIGAVIGVYVASKAEDISLWPLLDYGAVIASVGLALGRLGNYINGELYNHPWAIVKNIIIAVILFYYLKNNKYKPGQVAALWLMLYGIARFVFEYIRLPEWPIVYGLTRGQWYTLPLIMLGLWLWIRLNNLKKLTSS